METKMKWLVALVAVLMVVNIALVAFIWLRKDEGKKPGRPVGARDYLAKSLEMTDAQVQRFDSLRKGHFEKMEQYKTTMRFIKDRLFTLLREKDSNQLKTQINDYLKGKIGEIQANIDLETFNHFYQLRSILTTHQQNTFDSIIADVLRMAAPHAGFPPGRPLHDLKEGPPPE